MKTFVTAQSRNANTVNVQDKIDFSSKVSGSPNEQTSIARKASDIIRWRRAPAGRTCLNCCGLEQNCRRWQSSVINEAALEGSIGTTPCPY
jgi:hypothetical protein